MTRLPTPLTSSHLAQFHIRQQRLRRVGPSPRRCNTSGGNDHEGQVRERHHGPQPRVIRALVLTEARSGTQMRHRSNNNSNSTESSTTFLDKMGLARSARTAPSLRLLWLSSAGSGSVTLQGVADGVAASGRDVSGGADGVFRSGLLAGKHDGNNAAYDMKSLGKHIEAVRSSALSPP
jgi:hypothetical protein